MSHDPHDCYDWDDAEECANCGGEGYVSSCFEEWACMHPEDGCELCMRRCDWCNPAPKKPEKRGQRAPSDTGSRSLREQGLMPRSLLFQPLRYLIWAGVGAMAVIVCFFPEVV